MIPIRSRGLTLFNLWPVKIDVSHSLARQFPANSHLAKASWPTSKGAYYVWYHWLCASFLILVLATGDATVSLIARYLRHLLGTVCTDVV